MIMLKQIINKKKSPLISHEVHFNAHLGQIPSSPTTN